MHFDRDILVALARTLGIVEVNKEELDQYDTLLEYLRKKGGTIHAASKATGLPVTYQALVIVAIGQIYNWLDGGNDAALTMPEPEAFDVEIAADEGPERELVKQAVFTLRLLAWADTGDRTKLHEAGKALFNLVERLLVLKQEHFDLAISLSLFSREILERFDDPDAKLAQLHAYRMLVLPKRLPFLPDLPPTKFPPPLPPAFEENALRHLCLDFIQQGILDQTIDLSASALEMRDDPKAVINNQVTVSMKGEFLSLKIEIAFGRELIRWSFEDNKWSSRGIGVNEKLRALLSILCKNRELLEAFRDDDFGYVYQVMYLGFDNSPDRLRLALKIESVENFVRCVVGLSIADVRTNNTRDHIFSERKDTMLEGIRTCIATET